MKKQLFCIYALLALLISGQAMAQTTLMDYGSTWKYLDNGTNQGTAWRASAFNDATWASGTGYFGYGDSWINTCVNACGTVSCNPSCGTKYITTYFRKVINIPDLSQYESIQLNAYRDDGIVVYVNGTEVWRSNMPAGTIAYNTLANSPAIGGSDETTPVSITVPISSFTTGNNTISVELHQQDASSSDLTFNMQAIGNPAPIAAFGSTWKYLDNGSNQATAWRAVGFDDASWSSGSGYFGYGDSWINTCLKAGASCPAPSGPGCVPGGCTKYTTAYFRKVINIADPSLYDFIKLNAYRDDGIVVYVNGVEVWREHMPSGTIAYTTLASSPEIGGTGETTPVSQLIPISNFTTGNNTIAVEVHQQSLTSSDVTFNMEITGIPHVPPTVTQGPYLQMGNKTAVTVKWRTNVPCRSRVLAGTALGTYPIVVNDASIVTEHEVRITGLTQDTKYFYQVGTDAEIIQGDASNFFTTAPADDATRRVTMAVFGDCGRNDNSFQSGSLASYQSYLAANNMQASDLMLLVGDNAYNSGTDAEFTSNFFSRYSSNILKNHMLFPTPGNHDYANDGNRQNDHNVPYFSLFNMPSNGECGGVPSGTEAYYSYDWGNIHVLSLDSYGEEDGGTTRLYDTNGSQVNWIKNDLAANNKKWTIVYFHHPPFTKGSHNSDNESELVNIRQNFIRILERYGVDMVICGHSHDYERSYLLKNYYGSEVSFNLASHAADASSARYNGTTNSCPYTYPSGKFNHGTVYVVSGSAGADGGTQSGYPHDALPFSIDDGGMFFLDFNDNRLNAKFLRRNNTIADSFTIIKDTKAEDTVQVFPGANVTVNASWPGAYAWNTGATTRGISITADADTMLTVKDKNTGTCITDKHYIDVVCTTPVFTSSPSNTTVSPCNAMISYSVSDTATPTPTLSYAFSGATTGSGASTGSGTLFNPGNTVITLSATNTCGTTLSTFTVTVNPFPNTVSVSGAGTYCDHTTITASNGGSGTIYYQGIVSGGTSTLTPATSAEINGTGTYYFRALGTDGCWGAEGSAAVVINPIPTVTFITEPIPLVCAGTNVSYKTQTGMSDYTWSFPGAIAGTDYTITSGGTTADSVVTIKWLTQSTRTAAVNYANSFGCTAPAPTVSNTINVIYAPAPIAGNAQLCSGGSNITLTNTAAMGTWSGGTTGIATVNATTGLVTSGNTQGMVTISYANGCGTATTITTSVNAAPGTITGNMNLCANGSSTTLANIATNGTWTSNNVSVATIAINTGVVTASTNAGLAEMIYSNGCGTPASATVVVRPLPAVHTFTGGGAYCAGDAGVPVGLTLSQTGVSYQLYRNDTSTGSPVNGTGAAISFGIQTLPGIYHAIATSLSTSCTNYLSGVTIIVNARPAVETVTGGGSYCETGAGLPVGITGSAVGIAYQLYNGSTATGALFAGTGSAISFGPQTAAGTYSVLATDSYSLCAAGMNGAAAISVDPLPTDYDMTGGGAFCAGDSGVHIGVGNSDVDIAYTLFNGSTIVGTPFTGTGAAIDMGLLTTAGVYTVEAANTITGCTKILSSSKTIVANELPQIYSVTGGGSYCAGSTGRNIDLANTDAGISYELYNAGIPTGIVLTGVDAAASFGLVTAPGMYSAIATNLATGCQSTMADSTNIVITPLVVPQVDLELNTGIDNRVCAGMAVTFTAQTLNGGDAPAYIWKVNGAPAIAADSTYTYVPADGDKVFVQLTSNDPCPAPAQVRDSIFINVDTPAAPSVFLQVDPLTSVKPGDTVTLTAVALNCGAAPTYQWYKNGTPVASATTPVYTSTQFANRDSISCEVTSSGLCGGLVTSNSVVLTVYPTSINGTTGSTAYITIMPNPNKGQFTVTGTLLAPYTGNAHITITDVLGHTVYASNTAVFNGSVNQNIQLSNKLANGMYLLTLRSDNEQKVLHFVLEQ